MTWWDAVAKMDGRQFYRRKLYNGAGSGARWNTWNDPTNVIASQADSRYWERQGIEYPAAILPMGPSVDAGVTEHLRLLEVKDPQQEWAGVYYSQMGIVAYEVFQAIQGTRHAETLSAMVILGPPAREKNVANGNKWAGLPMPGNNTRGISDERFVNTPDYIYDFVNRGDIYGEVADDDTGEDMTMVFRAVQWPKALLLGKDSAWEQLREGMQSPLTEGIAAVKAIWNGLTFVGSSPWPTYAHTSYQTEPCVRLLNEIGARKPVVLR